jgi:hypothetical protein
MKAVYRDYVMKAEQYTLEGPLPAFAKKAGTHGTGIYVLAGSMSSAKMRLLQEGDWILQDRFGEIWVFSDIEFKEKFVEVK